MLPYVNTEENNPPMGRKVYINPNFRSQISHVVTQQQAPLVSLQSQTAYQLKMPMSQPAIHINPNFLKRQQVIYQHNNVAYNNQTMAIQRQLGQQQVPYYQSDTAIMRKISPPPVAKIISKASTCIVRKPSITVKPKKPVGSALIQPPLVSKTKRKIVRQSATPGSSPKSPPVPITTKRTKYKLVRTISLNSSSTPLVKKRRTREFVGRYALRRTNDTHAAKKLNTNTHFLSTADNKSVRLVSIHGVMYKKLAQNKLTKLNTTEKPAHTMISKRKDPVHIGRTLFVRGTRFILDPTGCRLTRLPINTPTHVPISSPTQSKKTACSVKCRRIDIGGLTYVASPKAQNIFIRTSNHVSRAHLMTAKQRSLQMLNRSLVKTNIPCAIFQKLGKCAAYNRGKCHKVHDKRQIAICPRFLRDACTKVDCLLSHNVTLEKMPVCRYYLLGACVREDCPYLHKKLSRKVEICIDFLRGYCSRAAECNKRHEFLCPELDRKGKCELTNCTFCKHTTKSKSQNTAKHKTNAHNPTILTTTKALDVDTSVNSRYFKCKGAENFSASSSSALINDQERQKPLPTPSEEHFDENIGITSALLQRPKLGSLPAFIPLGEE